MNIDNRPPTDELRPTQGPIHTLWKISNGHISATRHPIDFVFGSRVSRVGFSRSADRTALFPVGSNPKWRPAAILKKNSNGHISATHYPLHFIFVHRPYFWRKWQEMGHARQGNIAEVRYKEKERNDRFGEIDEKKGAYIRLITIQSISCLKWNDFVRYKLLRDHSIKWCHAVPLMTLL